MSLYQILLPSLRSSAAVIGAFTLAGSGLWLAKSAFVCTVMAESPAAPRRAFSGFLGPSLPLEKSESVNHNTKRLRFKFPTSDTNSGLNLTCRPRFPAR
jgi:cytochrome-b5 reductase